ncbi:hypothetical protein Q8791_23595 [Nocardiopsis sp. CT-R113]|uniref:SHOCT domain-containing protein n=1 Tax=Nocardiopsis codii TaxID=3065942 RepID=A0ABU7KD99_9ACTN|nr:hypothetical protein [Nocardiopsis sp. CT-R113]MEE2040206.1 hypothetical protein [Nocardiopsis sp. CT-R113]
MREDLKKATAIGGFVGLQKALAAAETELAPTETVNAAGAGNLDGKACAIIATNRRVLFVSAGLFGRTSTSSVVLPVAGVERGRGKLTLNTAGGDRTVRVISGARELEKAVLDPAGGPVKTWVEASEGQTPKGADHPLVQKPLATLAKQLDQGKITPEEYAGRRAEVLAQVEHLGK